MGSPSRNYTRSWRRAMTPESGSLRSGWVALERGVTDVGLRPFGIRQSGVTCPSAAQACQASHRANANWHTSTPDAQIGSRFAAKASEGVWNPHYHGQLYNLTDDAVLSAWELVGKLCSGCLIERAYFLSIFCLRYSRSGRSTRRDSAWPPTHPTSVPS